MLSSNSLPLTAHQWCLSDGVNESPAVDQQSAVSRLRAAPSLANLYVRSGRSNWLPAALLLKWLDDGTERKWNIRQRQRRHKPGGPFAGRQLISLWQRGELNDEHDVQAGHNQPWQLAGVVTELHSKSQPARSGSLSKLRPSSAGRLYELAFGPRLMTRAVLCLALMTGVAAAAVTAIAMNHGQRLELSLRAAEAWANGNGAVPAETLLNSAEREMQRFLARPDAADRHRLAAVYQVYRKEQTRQNEIRKCLKSAEAALQQANSSNVVLSNLERRLQRSLEDGALLYVADDFRQLDRRARAMLQRLRNKAGMRTTVKTRLKLIQE